MELSLQHGSDKGEELTLITKVGSRRTGILSGISILRGVGEPMLFLSDPESHWHG